MRGPGESIFNRIDPLGQHKEPPTPKWWNIAISQFHVQGWKKDLLSGSEDCFLNNPKRLYENIGTMDHYNSIMKAISFLPNLTAWRYTGGTSIIQSDNWLDAAGAKLPQPSSQLSQWRSYQPNDQKDSWLGGGNAKHPLPCNPMNPLQPDAGSSTAVRVKGRRSVWNVPTSWRFCAPRSISAIRCERRARANHGAPEMKSNLYKFNEE